MLSKEKEAELAAYKASLDPLAIARKIDRLQQLLIKLAAERTRNLQHHVLAKQALPDPGGIKIHPTG